MPRCAELIAVAPVRRRCGAGATPGHRAASRPAAAPIPCRDSARGAIDSAAHVPYRDALHGWFRA
jgi:hypothetical protein